MAQLTAAQIQALKTTLVARFNQGLVSQSDDYKKVAGTLSSSSASNTYAWLSQFPMWRQWVGSRLHKAVSERAYDVPNLKFENTIDIPREAIEDDAFGHYGDIAQSYGESISDLYNTLIFGALNNGFASLCYDGQYFFDFDHPVYANEDGTGAVTNANNLLSGTGESWFLLCTKKSAKPLYLQHRSMPEFYSVTGMENPDTFNLDKFSFGGRYRGAAAYGFWQCAFGSKTALDVNNFNIAYNTMMARKGDGNRIIGIIPDMLVVGPNNRAAADQLINAQFLASGASNTNYKKVEVLVSPWVV
jgi:phage major head subunit gpT-like protein